MKSIIIYESVHHNNTEKIAKVIANEINAELVNVKDFKGSLESYDLIGIGSGIFYGKFHKNIRKFIEDIESLSKKKTFVFSTSGHGGTDSHKKFIEILANKGFDVVAEFGCKGFDTFLPFKLVGGVNKGRPNDEDLAIAREFGKSLLS